MVILRNLNLSSLAGLIMQSMAEQNATKGIARRPPMDRLPPKTTKRANSVSKGNTSK